MVVRPPELVEETRTAAPRADAVYEIPFRRGDAIDRFTVLEPLGVGGMGVVVSAFDPVLDRKVAIKVLRPDRLTRDPEKGRARLLREAQAMARLSHPNVISVYEVGTLDDQVFVAMELVEGETLSAWQGREARPWREVVRVFAQAGDGLAASHRAGLVHRDFKPDNVLVSAGGEVRVTDFGLAGVSANTPEDAAMLSAPLTRTGAMMGTPAYMSPEQHRGEEADARSDQFSFCVSLYEALYGVRPFAGKTATEVLEAIVAGRLTPSRKEAPRRLRSLIARGLSVRPDERWPSIDALLAALRRDPAAGRRRWLVGGVLVATLLVAGRLSLSRDDPCPAPEQQLAAVWGQERVARVRARLLALDPAQGAVRFAAAARMVEPFARAWRDMHVSSCQATRVRGEQSDSLFDLRSRCLNRRLSELDGSTGLLLSAATPEQLDGAIAGLAGLEPVAVCGDEAALAAELAAPAAPAARATAERLADRIQKVSIEERAGRLVGLPDKARALVAEARRLAHAPTLAAALAAQARVDLGVGDRSTVENTLRELTQVAARARDDRLEAFAWQKLITLTSFHRGRPDRALLLIPAASAAVIRAGEPTGLRADMLYAEAIVATDDGRPRDALAHLARARRMLERAGGTQPGSPLAARLATIVLETANVHTATGDQAAAAAHYREAIALWRSLYGKDSVDEAMALHNLGETLRREGALDQGLAAVREAARINQARTGQSLRLAGNLTSIAALHEAKGALEPALDSFDRSLAIQRRVLGSANVELAPALLGRAMVLNRLGRNQESARDYGDAIAVLEKAHANQTNLPIAYYNRGELWRRQGRCADAQRDYRRAQELFRKQRGPDHAYGIYPLVGQGRCLMRTGRPDEAIDRFDRALAIEGDGAEAVQKALARAWRGRALVESGRDRKGGMAQARAGRAELAAAAENDPLAAEELRDFDARRSGR
jgi:eukaryotic-like serine/threonine-protein kinase